MRLLTSRMDAMDAMELLGVDPRPASGSNVGWELRHQDRLQAFTKLMDEHSQIVISGVKRRLRQQQMPVLSDLPRYLRRGAPAERAELTKDRAPLLELLRNSGELTPEFFEKVRDAWAEGCDDMVMPLFYGPRGLPSLHQDAKRHLEIIRQLHAKWRKTKNGRFHVNIGRLTTRRKMRVSALRDTPLNERVKFVASDYCQCWICRHAARFDQSGVYRG